MKELKSGKTFSQTEALVDAQLKNTVFTTYQHHPLLFVKNALEEIRTFFLYSYFDISDAVVLLTKPINERMKFVSTSSDEYNNHGKIRQVLFQISRVYKWILLLSFLAFPIIVFQRYRKQNHQPVFQSLFLYFPTLLSVLATALFTGAAGDRMRLPFNAIILIFCILAFKLIFTTPEKKSSKSVLT
ncbi:MAG: hypothetical protein HQL13_00395 [Candidatus Omnitrophica bacterium]|nr:hypothetical protein [Candidatus Omnitrophota bacterium]